MSARFVVFVVSAGSREYADAVEIKYSFIDVEGYIKREEKGLFVINIVYVKLVRVLTAMDDIIPTYFIAF